MRRFFAKAGQNYYTRIVSLDKNCSKHIRKKADKTVLL